MKEIGLDRSLIGPSKRPWQETAASSSSTLTTEPDTTGTFSEESIVLAPAPPESTDSPTLQEAPAILESTETAINIHGICGRVFCMEEDEHKTAEVVTKELTQLYCACL